MTPTPSHGRLAELLAMKATQKLTPAEMTELDTLLDAFPDQDPESFELAAAAVHLALSGPLEEMPTALAEKLYVASVTLAPSAPATPARPAAKPRERAERGRPPAWVAWSGWAVAASFGAVAMFALARGPRVEVRPERVEVPGPERIVEKIVKVPEPVYLPPPATYVKAEVDKDPNAARFEVKDKDKVTANVVWSAEQNQGYLEIRGLPLNNPNQKQYQLWVIDQSRPDAKPISAGVFDVKPEGTTLVRVDASLKFRTGKTLFAISEEPPGGLVQPTQDKILMLIPPKKT